MTALQGLLQISDVILHAVDCSLGKPGNQLFHPTQLLSRTHLCQRMYLQLALKPAHAYRDR